MKKDKIILCIYCKQPFSPTIAQLKSYDYRCQPCRYKYSQKKYEEKNPTYGRDWKRKNRKKLLRKRKPYYKLEWSKQKTSRQKYLVEHNEVIQTAKNKPCMDCGVQYPSFIMHFDHRDSTTKIKNVGAMGTYSLKRIIEEISKCDVVCANCHGLRTLNAIRNGKIKMFGGI